LDPLLTGLVEDALTAAGLPVRAAALSVAGPVDRDTGRLVHLPNSPFLVDELDPRRLLDPIIGREPIIDNDVNWAASAEYHDGVAADLDDFCYVHLGHGLGGSVVRNGRPVRGAAGLAGEPAHMITAGPRGRAMRLIEVFSDLDMLQPASPAIDVIRVSACLEGSTATDRRRRDIIVDAVAGVIASMVALLNPDGVVVGGPWSTAGDFAERLSERVESSAVVATQVRTAQLGVAAPLVGARFAAVQAAQSTLLGPLAQEIAS
jgi:predicted NBD/HSP70 family sugar kinase